MKKATKQSVSIEMMPKEWALLLLSVNTALKQRTCKESFPTRSCKTGLRRLDKRLFSLLKDVPQTEVRHA